MEIIIVGLFLAYIAYREWMMNERLKDLELKAISRNPQELAEYQAVAAKEDEEEEEEESPLVDPFEVSPEDALKGKVQ